MCDSSLLFSIKLPQAPILSLLFFAVLSFPDKKDDDDGEEEKYENDETLEFIAHSTLRYAGLDGWDDNNAPSLVNPWQLQYESIDDWLDKVWMKSKEKDKGERLLNGLLPVDNDPIAHSC